LAVGWKDYLHVGNEESTIWLSADLIHNRAENSTVALLESRPVRVGYIPIECSVLGLEKGQKTASDQSLSIDGWSKMMGRIATGGNVCQLDDGTEGVLQISAAFFQILTIILTSSRLIVAKKSLFSLFPEPVQIYPTFFGLMLEGVNGGLSIGGVGS
jgi:hypothetical protein